MIIIMFKKRRSKQTPRLDHKHIGSMMNGRYKIWKRNSTDRNAEEKQPEILEEET